MKPDSEAERCLAAIADLDFVGEHIVVDGIEHVCVPRDIWEEIISPILKDERE